MFIFVIFSVTEFELLPHSTQLRSKRARRNAGASNSQFPPYVTMRGSDEQSVILKYPRQVLEISSQADNMLGLRTVGLYRAEFATISTLLHAGRNSIEQ